jgi:two-component system response regulator FixJ
MTGVVHVIDDDDALRDALAAMLSARGLSVKAYPSARAFLDILPQAERGCVVTDVQMPEMTGLELLQRMEQRLESFPVIVLTGRADVPIAVQALKGGASDFIEKPFEGDVIYAAVQGALARIVGQAEASEEKADYVRRLAALAPREREVLRGVVAGQSNKEIARDLGISPRTIETYRANLMTKMGAQNLSELVRMSLVGGGPGQPPGS